MIVYGIKVKNQYLTNHNRRGIYKFWFTSDIVRANKWKYKASIEKNAKKIRKELTVKVEVVGIEIKEIESTKNVKIHQNLKIENTLVL